VGVGLLGPLTVGGDSSAVGPRDRVVLAALAVHHGDSVSVETLADALWGEEPPASAAKVIQGCIARLRKVLGAHAIETVPHGYVLSVPADSIDVSEFEHMVSRGRELLALGEADRAAFVIDQALDLWRGEPYVDLDGWEPGRQEAGRLEELRLDAEELSVEARIRAGRVREVLSEAHRLATTAPLRERRWAQLALVQYQAGRQADALETIRQARRVLAEELGLDPGQDLVDLEQAILRQDPRLAAAPAMPEESPTCPYLGLVPYDIDDADAFFGRDADVAECLRRISDDGLLVVVGPSGSGKSSLVRAGLAAALRRDGKRVVVLTPGSRPMGALREHLHSGRAPVLVVDQCEEAVTLCRDPDEQVRFFAALADHAARGTLIVAMRADRLGEMSAHPEFARLIERGLYLLRRMDEDDLRAAIEGPAHQAGLLLEHGLVDLLIRDVEGEPGALPLLSHALRQTWDRREGRTLTVAGYQATGGIRGAVAQTAETVYEQAPAEQRPILRDLLLRLVTPSPEGEPVRSRVPRRVVAADPEQERVVEELVRARLVTSDEEVIELAHEALARAWPRLRGWLDDDVEGQRIWRQVALAADAWDAMGRPESELYRGLRLSRALEWRDRTTPGLNPTEEAFLDAGHAAAEAERRSAEERARHQIRVNRRLRALVAVVGVLAIAAATGGLVARNQAQRANLEADVARSHELAAASTSALADDPTLARLLAVASATAAEPTLESTTALHRTWFADRVVARYSWTDPAAMYQLFTDVDHDWRRLVASANSDHVEVVDPFTGERMWGLTLEREGDLNAGGSNLMEFSDALITDDGEYVVAGLGRYRPRAHSGGIYVWRGGDGELVRRIDTGPCGAALLDLAEPYAVAMQVKYHPRLPEEEACPPFQGPAGPVELIDIETGKREVLARHPRYSYPNWGAALSSDRRHVAYDDLDIGADGGVVVLDLETGDRTVLEPSGHQDQRGVRELNGDASLMLYGQGPTEVWDIARGELVATFEDPVEGGGPAKFAVDGTTVYSTGRDGALRHWNALSGQQFSTFGGVGFGGVQVTGEGRVLASNLREGTASLLDFRPRGELGVVQTCPGTIPPDRLAVVGRVALFPVYCQGDRAATTYAVSLDDQKPLYTLPGQGGDALAVSPDGSRFVRQERDGTQLGPLTIRDVETGDRLLDLKGTCTWDAEGIEGPDQRPDAPDGCAAYPKTPFPTFSDRMRWSPDGTMLAASVDNDWAVWDTTDGRLLYRQDHVNEEPDEPTSAVFTPDSTRLVTYNLLTGFHVLSTSEWEVLTETGFQEGLEPPTFLGYSADPATLLALGSFIFESGNGQLEWIDGDTLELARSKDFIHDGAIITADLSPSRARIATGSRDGFVKVWAADTGALLHQIPIEGSQVHGIAFIDESHLAITTAERGLLIVTTNPRELLDLTRATLTRGFTATECEQYNFDDHCPSLAEMRGTRG
jgi:DNA-binding SARP family transcriptional activator/WD40 repeat protein/energy-coupling factor transporter ATP-binding protein EcfA2